ncbi:YbaB/EbfC family nucleoid-associated protein [Saccharomonospora piscinae]|nr:YbaB/EbfC family nucleoid-associated protein [Saccharomonospora piscinae]TLW92319.1 YbaB/EbfC family nucleoid-associated protein [Saccharomonospora piscinae]
MSGYHDSGRPPFTVRGMAADESMRQVEDAVELAVRRDEQFTEARRQIDALTATERSPGGAMEVTVGSDGNVLDVRCTDQINTLSPREIADTVRSCVQRAQAGIAREVERILRATAPGDPLTEHLVANAHQAFPAPAPDEPAPEVQTSAPGRRRIGGPGNDGDDPDDDWNGRPVLSRTPR